MNEPPPRRAFLLRAASTLRKSVARSSPAAAWLGKPWGFIRKHWRWCAAPMAVIGFPILLLVLATECYKFFLSLI